MISDHHAEIGNLKWPPENIAHLFVSVLDFATMKRFFFKFGMQVGMGYGI
jgi:hypothetical protein